MAYCAASMRKQNVLLCSMQVFIPEIAACRCKPQTTDTFNTAIVSLYVVTAAFKEISNLTSVRRELHVLKRSFTADNSLVHQPLGSTIYSAIQESVSSLCRQENRGRQRRASWTAVGAVLGTDTLCRTCRMHKRGAQSVRICTTRLSPYQFLLG